MTSTEGTSTTGAVKDQAASVATGAVDAAKNVGGTAKEQVKEVATDARRQVQHFVGQARTELTDQASTQQQRAAGGLQGLGEQLRSLASGNPQSGAATDLAHQAADKVQEVAQWLESREPGDILDDVRNFARQKPGLFLALSLGAGIVAGRLARGLTADTDDQSGSSGRALPAATPMPQITAPPMLSTDYTTGYAPATGYGTTSGYGGATGGYAAPATGYVAPTPGYVAPTSGYASDAAYAADAPTEQRPNAGWSAP